MQLRKDFVKFRFIEHFHWKMRMVCVNVGSENKKQKAENCDGFNHMKNTNKILTFRAKALRPKR